MKTFLLNFCILCYLIPFASLSDEENGKLVESEGHEEHKKEKVKDPMKDKQYLAEIAAGDNADLFSTNIHKMVPPNFPDFGRRFVMQYPYSEKTSSQIDNEAEDRLDKIIKEALQGVNQHNNEEERIRPVRAPAHVVLAVARQSAMLQKTIPVKQDQFVDKQALRNGDYWNSVWIEEVPKPSQNLRTNSKALESVRVKIMPGSKLYKLVSMTRDLSPKLLYVINENNENK